MSERAELLAWLGEQEALATAATKGPWFAGWPSRTCEIKAHMPNKHPGRDAGCVYELRGYTRFEDGGYVCSQDAGEMLIWPDDGNERLSVANCDFIAASRSVVPAMLLALRLLVEKHADCGDDCRTVALIYNATVGAMERG